MKRVLLLWVAVFTASFAHEASGFTKTTSFQASVTALDACSVSATPMNFGSVPIPLTTNADATSAITVNCTNGPGWTLSLSTGASGLYGPRHLLNGSGVLVYNLYTDFSHFNVWGDGTGGTVTISGSGTGADQVNTVYGRISAGQAPPTGGGVYSDTITVTLAY